MRLSFPWWEAARGRGAYDMRWNLFIVTCGVAVVALGFALAFLEGAHQAYEQADGETITAER